MELLGYQRRWIEDRSRFKVGMFARQTGKTFTTCLEILLSILKKEEGGGRERWVILSRGERQAKEAMDEGFKRHLQAVGCGFRENFIPFQTVSSSLEVKFSNGSCVTALPANPDTARGYSANVFLDEFAFHQDSDKIWESLFPVISHGDKRLIITSTPNGKNNRFYKIINGGGNWSRHIVTIYDAIKDGLKRDVGKLKEMLNDADSWAQEFELQWVDEASSWLSYELIESCVNKECGISSNYTDGICYLGVDIAVRNDLFVATVIEENDSVFYLREMIEGRKIGFQEQDKIIDGLMKRYRVGRVCVDQSGIGERSVEELQRMYGEYMVNGVIFTQAAKLDMALKARKLFEQKRIQIPFNMDLINDLHKITKTVGQTGVIRLTAERDRDGHADRAWSLFLACEAINDPVAKYEATLHNTRVVHFEKPIVTYEKGDASGWGMVGV